MYKGDWLLQGNYYDELSKQLEYETQLTVNGTGHNNGIPKRAPTSRWRWSENSTWQDVNSFAIRFIEQDVGPRNATPHTYTRPHIWWIDVATAAAC